MWSIFDCLTRQRVSDKSYDTHEEASHDYYLNQGHTFVTDLAGNDDCLSGQCADGHHLEASR